jgi:predicted anti-sigma-YlaC factor YlaD
MIKCKDVPELASDYLDGDLPLSKRIALRFHLLICHSCRAYLQQLRNTIKTVKVLQPKEKGAYDHCPLIKKFRELTQKQD